MKQISVAVLLIALAFAIRFGAVFLLWNWIAPIFGLPQLSFFESVALVFLIFALTYNYTSAK